MQKITAAVGLLCVAALAAWAAVYPQGPDIALSRETLVVLAVACGLVGASLVVLFNKGDVVARLQKGMVVISLLAAVLTMAIVPLGKYVPGWRLRLAHYPELSDHACDIEWMPDAMDVADSVISEHLLASQPELWRNYGRYVVSCARMRAVPVESVVGVMLRETQALSLHNDPNLDGWVDPGKQGPELVAAAKAEVARRGASDFPSISTERKVELTLWAWASRREAVHRRFDSVMAGIAWENMRSRQPAGMAAAEVWRPDWLAKLTLAGSELLAGFAIVIVLGLLRRKPKKAGETDHAM